MITFKNSDANAKNTKLNFNLAEISKINITSLPSPPDKITVENKESIEKIVNMLNDLELKKVKNQNEKGWKHLIEIIGKETFLIQISYNFVIVDGYYYEVTNINDLILFFNNLIKEIQNEKIFI